MSLLGEFIKLFGNRKGASVPSHPISDPIPRPTGDPVAEYKVFIDALSGPSFHACRVREINLCDYSQRDDILRFLSGLTPEQREVVAQMVEVAEDFGTWHVLNVIGTYGFRLSREGVELPCLFPFGLTTLWGSWWCRKRGEAWPQSPAEAFESLRDD